MAACKPGNKTLLILSVIWVGLLLGTHPAVSQETGNALVRGTVHDASGTPTRGARVTVRSLATSLTHLVSSDSVGQFEITELPPGKYQVEVAADRTSSAEPQQIELSSGETREIDFVLGGANAAGPSRENSEATAPSSGANSNLIRQDQLVGLPLNGRSYSQLATLQSDVTDTGAGSASRGTGGGTLTMAGGRPLSNDFLMDGTSITNAENAPPRSAAGVQLGSDAVLQVQVSSGFYGAEHGRTSGGVLNSITRSGTPQFHGTFFEYFRNSKLDARNFFDREANPPPFKRNQFGFVLTGPIVKEKTFFMVSFEAMRDRLNQTTVNFFPDERARLGDLGNGRTIPVDERVVPYLALYPIPNDLRLSGGIGRHLAPQFLPTDENFLSFRIDQRLTERDSLFARYTFDDASSYSSRDAYLFRGLTKSRQQYLTLVASHTFSPRTLASFRFGYTRPVDATESVSDISIPSHVARFVPGVPEFGQISVSGLTPFGPLVDAPGANILNSFQFAGDVYLQKGLHTLKLGFDIDRYRSDVFNNWGRYGIWYFNGVENFLRAGREGTDLRVALPGSDNRHGYRQTLAGFYVQDQFRIRPNLQLNLGLRHEFVTQISDTLNRIPVLRDPLHDTSVEIGKHYLKDNPSLLNFAPRFGIAWSPGGGTNTTVNAGFGIYFDQLLSYAAVMRKVSGPFYSLVIRPNFDASSSTGFPNAIAAAGDNQPLVQIMDYSNSKTPMVLRYNLAVLQRLTGGWQFQASYTGARGNRLLRRYEINQFPAPITQPDGSLFFPPNVGTINPAFDAVNLLSTDAQSFYNAVQISAGRSLGRGISVQGGYTFSKSVDDSSTGPAGGSVGYQYGLLRTQDRGLSDFDIRHRLTFNYFYSLPFRPKVGNRVLDVVGKALEGWRVGGIASFRSGTPFTPEVDIRVSDYLFSASRPDLLPGASTNPTEGVTEGCGRIAPGRKLGDPNLYFDPCSFGPPAPGRLGNLGRNTVIAPSVFSMDFSAQREFLLDATKRLQFRAEIFNLPNHTNFGSVAGSSLTVFSGGTGDLNSTAGRINGTASTSRQIQFALRFSF